MGRITINSNLLALKAQRRLTESSGSLTQSFQRLSSGLRVNTASDDAAALSVSSRLTLDRRVFNQATRNINDGISFMNIAESAMSSLSDVVIRIQELAEQSANGTLSSTQRGALQQQVNELQNEYNRIVQTTTFNGTQLLTGVTTKTTLQGGYGEIGQLAVQIGAASLGIAYDPNRAGLLSRVDTASDGTLTNGFSGLTGISADGRYIVFTSNGTNLVSGDTNAVVDVFVKDVLTGATERVSSDSNGNQANAASSGTNSISADGRYVIFESSATNLVAGDTNAKPDIFMKDRLTGNTVMISSDSSGNEGNEASFLSAPGGISADGRYVVFQSNATNLVGGDTNASTDVFLKDTRTGTTVRVSTDSSGNQANGTSEVRGISADGRYVLFESNATNLVDGDTNARQDVFVKDMLTGKTIRASTDSNGNQGNEAAFHSSISADGRYVAFAQNGSVFRKDLLTQATVMVSTNSSDTPANNYSERSAISADGRYVLFDSLATNLADGASGLVGFNVFRKDVNTGETTFVSAGNDGNMVGVIGSSGYGTLSADGRYAVFSRDGGVYMRDLTKTGIQQLSGMLVSNQASARVTLDMAKRYQEELSLYKAGIGASVSRARTFVSTLQQTSENYAQASSRITDIDVADEVAGLQSTKILQQITTAVLAQAKLQPEIALRLLN